MTLQSWPQRHPLFSYFAVAYGVSWGGIFAVFAATGFDLENLRPLDIDLIFVLMLYSTTSFEQGLVWQTTFAVALWLLVALVIVGFVHHPRRPVPPLPRSALEH